MQKHTTILCFLFATFLPGMAQPDTALIPVKKISGDIIAFTADNLDNIYLLSSTDQLKKLNANGDSIAVFNNVKRNGKVSKIDVSNPMRVLLYYKDFATVVILDRLLNIRSSIDLRKQNIFQVQALGLSYDNRIWLFDEFENKLKKIDEDGKPLFETADFRQLFDGAFSFSSLFDQDGYLYLYDKSKGVFVFDYYGTLKNRIPMPGLDNFKVIGKYIFGTRNDSLLRYEPATFNSRELKLPPAFRQAQYIHFTSTRGYALKKDELEIYQLR